MHRERHRTEHIGWLRAAVLGANDGLISVSSIAVGVAAATPQRSAILIAALAGMVAGALSMAAGEYVSVSSQADVEQADLERETRELRDDPEGELEELTKIYEKRGIDRRLAEQVAKQLMEKDALGAHMRDELGITEVTRAQPLQAAGASAASFAVGAAPTVLLVLFAPLQQVAWMVIALSLIILVALGAAAAYLGGASMMKGAVRVTFWGAAAMATTYGIGRLFGTSVS